MARGKSTIVGGGIASGTPFTLNTFTIVTDTDPATIGDGNIRQDTSTPPKVYIGEASTATTATVLGGATGNANIGASIVIGEGAALTPSAGLGTNTTIVIGRAASGGTGTAGSNVVIGDTATVASNPNNAVVIGASASISGGAGTGNSSVVIGKSASQSAGTSGVVIGASASLSQNGGVVVGSGASANQTGCTVVGQNAAASAANCVVLGNGATSAVANAIIIGNSTAAAAANSFTVGHSNGITSMVIGKGDTSAAPQAVTFRLTNGTGSNIAGGALTLQAGLSTGNAASAAVNLAVGIVGASGAVLQTARTGLSVSYSTTAGDTYLMVFDVDNATLERVTVGAADSGGVGFKLLRIPN